VAKVPSSLPTHACLWARKRRPLFPGRGHALWATPHKANFLQPKLTRLALLGPSLFVSLSLSLSRSAVCLPHHCWSYIYLPLTLYFLVTLCFLYARLASRRESRDETNEVSGVAASQANTASRLEATATPRKRSQHSCLLGKKSHKARGAVAATPMRVQQANGRAAGTTESVNACLQLLCLVLVLCTVLQRNWFAKLDKPSSKFKKNGGLQMPPEINNSFW
jgi:hypothetical protein